MASSLPFHLSDMKIALKFFSFAFFALKWNRKINKSLIYLHYLHLTFFCEMKWNAQCVHTSRREKNGCEFFYKYIQSRESFIPLCKLLTPRAWFNRSSEENEKKGIHSPSAHTYLHKLAYMPRRWPSECPQWMLFFQYNFF